MGRYADRRAAGRVLGEAVRARGPFTRPVVLALPRGGVPVGAEVAAALDAPLAVVLVRKIGAPGRPELAIGALARVGSAVSIFVNERTAAAVGVDEPAFAVAVERARAELDQRATAYAVRSTPPVAGADVLLVDDGLATGSTMQAAVSAVRGLGPGRIVVAVPVAPASALDGLRATSDAVVCPSVPRDFVAVGQAYVDFAQLTDADVQRNLGA